MVVLFFSTLVAAILPGTEWHFVSISSLHYVNVTSPICVYVLESGYGVT